MEIRTFVILINSFLISTIIVFMAIVCSSCSAIIPSIFKTVDDLAIDAAIQVQIDKEAIDRDFKSTEEK